MPNDQRGRRSRAASSSGTMPVFHRGLIVANPTYVAGGRFPHTEAVLSSAANEDLQRRWPFDVADPCALVKLAPTPSSAGSSAAAKRDAAAALRSVLSVPDPSLTQGRRIL